jgi:hypothetical protein
VEVVARQSQRIAHKELGALLAVIRLSDHWWFQKVAGVVALDWPAVLAAALVAIRRPAHQLTGRSVSVVPAHQLIPWVLAVAVQLDSRLATVAQRGRVVAA